MKRAVKRKSRHNKVKPTSKGRFEEFPKSDRNSQRLALKRKNQISHREVRHDSKTLLQHLREQMKSSEGDYEHATTNDDDSQLRSSRLGALDLNVGLNQTKTNRHRERTKGPKETYDVNVNDSLDDESVEEDEVLQKMLQQHGDKWNLTNSIAEEVEEEQLSGDRVLANDRVSTSDGLVASPSSNTIIATREVQKTENSPTSKNDSPWKLTVEHEPSKLF